MPKYILMCMERIEEALKQTAQDIQKIGAAFLDFCIDGISVLLKAVVWIGLLATAPLWILPHYFFKKSVEGRKHELQTVEKEL